MQIVLRGTVKTRGVYHAPGTILDVEDSEAKRLVKMKVAQFPEDVEAESEEPVAESITEPDTEENSEEDLESRLSELTEVKGVTKALALNLIESGITDIASLQRLSVEDLTGLGLKGLGEKKASSILKDANEFTFED